MNTVFTDNFDFSIIIASLSGALVYILSQHHFHQGTKHLLFFISFSMGISGADFTLEIIRVFIPGVFSDERAIGAFFCSALVVTVIFGVMRRVEIMLKGLWGTHDDK